MVTRSYQSKVFIYAVLTLETSLKVDFGRFLTIFGVSQAVRFDTCLLPMTMIVILKVRPIYVLFTCNKRFFNDITIKLKINISRPDFWKISQNLHSGLALIDVKFSSLHQTDLKLGQCLDMDDITLPSKFGELTCRSSGFMDRSVCHTPIFASCYILFFKIYFNIYLIF